MRSGRTILKAMWTTMRPYLLFVSAITGIAGAAVSQGSGLLPFSLIFIASFFSYGFGQALTDCFQTDTDAISAPYRPLAAGEVSRTPILLLSLAGLTTCVILYALVNPWTLPLGLVAGAGLATYTPFKRRWWGGPWYNAWIVVALCVIGFLAGNGRTGFHLDPRLVPMCAAVFFGYANFVLAGYFKDISADRSTGYNTLPVVFGRTVAAIASDILALSFLLAAAGTADVLLRSHPSPFALLAGLSFAGAGGVHTLLAQVQLHRNRDDASAYRPASHVVHAYVLVLSGLIAILRPDWTVFLVLHYAAFVLVLTHRPEVTQI
jgi:4-hydroxybenzoate polyprenyltransferase